MDKKEMSKIAKNIFHHSRGVQKPKIIHPVRDWGVGITVAVLITAGLLVWSNQTYESYRNFTGNSEGDEQESATIYRETAVNQAIEEFSLRLDQHHELIKSLKDSKPLLPPPPLEVGEVSDDEEVEELVGGEQPTLEDIIPISVE